MPEVVLTGAAGRIEGRYTQGKRETAPVALIVSVPVPLTAAGWSVTLPVPTMPWMPVPALKCWL